MSARRVLVTGASGFIGRALVPLLRLQGVPVSAQYRTPSLAPADPHDVIADLGDLAGLNDGAGVADPDRHNDPTGTGTLAWRRALDSVDAVIHLAGIAHRDASVPDQHFERINHQASAALATLAQAAGVQRFILISSINAMGTATANRSRTADLALPDCYRPDTPETPCDAYGASKLAAEQALRQICARGAMQWTVVRPPLVYGRGAKGNLARLMRWVQAGYPVPVARPPNRRSMIGLPNLTSLIAASLSHDTFAQRIVLPSDICWSTRDLIAAIAAAMHRPARFMHLPGPAVERLGRLFGRERSVRPITASLVIADPWLTEWSDSWPDHDPAAIVAAMVDEFGRHP